MAASVVHFRSTPDLDRLIDAEVARLKAQGLPSRLTTRSVVIRSLLATALEQDARRAAMQEMLKSVWYIMQKSLGTAMDEVFAELRERAEKELEAIDRGDAERAAS